MPEPAAVAAELRALAKTFVAEFGFWQDYTRAFRREGDNVIPRDQPLAFSGHSTVRAAPKGFFVLEPDEAMLLEFDDPGGLFWSVALGDTWFRSFDPSHHQMSLNGAQARRDADGLYRMVIAHQDPGIANWLDTVGHRRGNITFRYVRTERRPEARLTVGPLAESSLRFPPGPRMSRLRAGGNHCSPQARLFAALCRTLHHPLEPLPMTIASPETLIERAAEATGLHDFGAEGWREGLGKLVATMSERDFGEVAKGRIEARLEGVLTSRLRIEDWIGRHPEVAQIEHRSPGVHYRPAAHRHDRASGFPGDRPAMAVPARLGSG